MLIWLLANWKWLLGAAASVALTIALLFARADAAHWHKIADNQALLIAKAKQEAAEQAEANAKRLTEATENYAERLTKIQPVIAHSKEVIREFRETPAGRVNCLAPERVRGIDEYDASLKHPTPATQGEGAVSNPASATTGGR